MWSFKEYKKEGDDPCEGVVMSIVSPDGDENYPGEVTVPLSPLVHVDERHLLSEHSKRAETGIRGTYNTPHGDQHDKPHVLEHVGRLQDQNLPASAPSERGYLSSCGRYDSHRRTSLC